MFNTHISIIQLLWATLIVGLQPVKTVCRKCCINLKVSSPGLVTSGLAQVLLRPLGGIFGCLRGHTFLCSFPQMNNVLLRSGGWVCFVLMAICLENHKKYVHPIGVGTGASRGRHPPQYLERGGREYGFAPLPNIWHYLGKIVPKYHDLCRSFVQNLIASGLRPLDYMIVYLFTCWCQAVPARNVSRPSPMHPLNLITFTSQGIHLFPIMLGGSASS